jgi:hypothetical protein
MNNRKKFLFTAPLILALVMASMGCRQPTGGNPSVPAAAEKPAITVQPQGTAYAKGDIAVPLSITVTSPADGGTLSYQWYKNNVDSSAGGEAITGATGAAYTPPTGTVGTVYYYVVVTNSGGGQTASTASVPAKVEVSSSIAPKPVIDASTSSLDSRTYYIDEIAAPLSVSASVTSGGALSYQWYSNSENSAAGGSAITDAINATYTPPVSTVGTVYYYVIVTNSGSGSTSNSVTSAVVKIEVNETPANLSGQITFDPVDGLLTGASYTQGAAAADIEVNATADGDLSYQWYRNTENSNTGGEAITGATKSNYAPPADTVGIFYYYCAVTNTEDGKDPREARTGIAIITVTLDHPAITVTQPGTGGTFTVKVGDGEPGSVSTTAEAATTVTLTAAPATGYRFKQWTVTGVTLADNIANPATFIMPGSAVTVTAEFEEHTDFTVTVSAWENEDDEDILASNSNVSLSQGGSGGHAKSFTATVNEEYGDIKWYVNGTLVTGTTENSITINAADYPKARYILGVTVTKAGVPYSTDIRFTVGD